MTINIKIDGVEMRVECTHYPETSDTWDEPGQAEYVELEAVYTLHGDDILPLVIRFGTACVIEAEALVSMRREYAGEIAQDAVEERLERLAG